MNKDTLEKYDRGEHHLFCLPQQIERDFNSLIGILLGINADGVIHTEEVTGIAEWLLATRDYQNREPYKELVNIISNALHDYHLEKEEIDDIIWYCEKCIQQIGYFDEGTSAIQQLYGILDGIAIDKEINDLELQYLKDWLFYYGHLSGKYPFDSVCKMISNFLVDGKIDQRECDELMRFCEAFKIEKINPINETKLIVEHVQSEIFEEVKQIQFDGKKVCITGESTLYKRSEIVSRLAELGSTAVSTVTSKTDLLIVCDKRSHAWTYSMYGRKLEQAIALKQKGNNIVILHIDDVYALI